MGETPKLVKENHGGALQGMDDLEVWAILMKWKENKSRGGKTSIGHCEDLV